MRRREALALLGAAAALWPLAARAQQQAMPVVGYLSSASPATYPPAYVAAFRQGLSETGYVEGKNVFIEYRWAEDHYDRLPALAGDLAARQANVIATTGGIVSALAAKGVTSTIPIVFAMGDDPVSAGVVASFARPGGNITGISFFAVELGAKLFELATELTASAASIGILVNPKRPTYEAVLKAVETAARAKGRQLLVLDASAERDFEQLFATLAEARAGALVVTSDPLYLDRRERLVALATSHAIPTVYAWREYVAAGGLISYGPSLAGAYRQVGIYAVMNRRNLMLAVGGAAALWPLTAGAQQKAMPVVGFLGTTSPEPNAPFVGAFHQGLGEAGYVEGQNVAIEYRWAEGSYDRLPGLAGDLAGRKVDLIVTGGGSVVALAAKAATSTIPIVFISGDDAVAAGLVAGLARPGGNLTGVSFLVVDLTAKLLELLSELVPRANVIALLVNPTNPLTERLMKVAQEAARAKGVQLSILKAGTEREIDAAFASLSRLKAGALVVGADSFFAAQREQFVALASRHAIPVIYPLREWVTAGGLVSYGPSLTAVYRQAGIYAGKILKGAKPADLPVQQPTRFELVVNLKTAKELGLTVPQTLLARADEVIE